MKRFCAKALSHNQRGMTLVEIMIVLAIIGGLLAVMGGSVVGQFEKARVKEAKIHLREIQKQLDIYNADCGSYPTTEQWPSALIKSPGEDACPNWGPDPYMKKEPKDPWNKDYIYESDGSTISVLKSLGKGGREGGDGYEKDILLDEI